jgi:dipeptide/tripeptide permease
VSHFCACIGSLCLRQCVHGASIGMVLCGVAFVMAALLEIWIGTSDEGSISVLWQLPQYIVLTSAEILFSIQGLAFSYAQAPSSMKSVVSSAWLITVAVGNSLTIAVASVQFFQKQEHEFFFFAGLVAFFAAVFAFVTREYQYVEDRERND